MANHEEDAQSSINASIMGLVDVTDPSIQNVFANDVFVAIGESDISLLFSFSFWDGGSKVNKPSVRIILSHNNFTKIIDFMQKRAELLRTAYSGDPPDILSGDPNELRLAFERMYGTEANPSEDNRP